MIFSNQTTGRPEKYTITNNQFIPWTYGHIEEYPEDEPERDELVRKLKQSIRSSKKEVDDLNVFFLVKPLFDLTADDMEDICENPGKIPLVFYLRISYQCLMF